MTKLMTSVALVLVATSLSAAEPASFTVEPTKNGVRIRFSDWEALAQKVTYSEAERRLTLSGLVAS